jgi:hypothetical protein
MILPPRREAAPKQGRARLSEPTQTLWRTFAHQSASRKRLGWLREPPESHSYFWNGRRSRCLTGK